MENPALVLVGNAKSGTIAAFRLGDESLELQAVTRVGAGCGTFAIDHARSLVYCATKEPDAGVLTLSLDRATGELTERARRAISDPLAYLALTREGALLLGASYHGGWGVAWPVADGRLGDPAGRVSHSNLHCVLPDAAGRFAYFVALGEDLVAQCSVGDDGALIPLDEPTVALPAGSGPRHLILSHDERSAYLMTEFTGEATRFDRDPATGALTPAESAIAHDTTRGLRASRFGANPKAEHLVWGADLHLAGEGGWLLCSERTVSTITTVGLDAAGHLTDVVAITDTEAQPRGFAVAPDGRRVVVVGEASGHATLYRVGESGGLEALDRVATEPGQGEAAASGPNWVQFA